MNQDEWEREAIKRYPTNLGADNESIITALKMRIAWLYRQIPPEALRAGDEFAEQLAHR